MHFSTLLLALSAINAISGHSLADSNAVGLRARSAKGLLHHLVRSLDEEDAKEIFARYDELSLGERDDEEFSSLQKRDYTCPHCGRTFVLIRELQEHVADHGNYAKPGKGKAPAKKGKAPAKKAKAPAKPAKKGRK
ncbi:unnamed protein product [Clonostachys rosea]|uniref:C2H2-type domain-containing protein n=1 Tax=Bionectria ochroleuca TaxID=29856 RepID=A0ABY6UHG3_BIOOC|nr:unnamed protein product [Clonostachys rosea]